MRMRMPCCAFGYILFNFLASCVRMLECATDLANRLYSPLVVPHSPEKESSSHIASPFHVVFPLVFLVLLVALVLSSSCPIFQYSVKDWSTAILFEWDRHRSSVDIFDLCCH